MEHQVKMRDAYGNALVHLGEVHSDVVVLSADSSNSDRSMYFEKRFPKRFYNMGIAEQSLVDTAVGFAYSGYVPFVNAFAVFLSTRALEMVRTHGCYGNANIKLMGAYAGLSDSFDGPTHHSLVDVAIMRSLPRMTVVVPSDPFEMESVIEAVYKIKGPVYVRLNRNEVPAIYEKDRAPKFEIGKSRLLRKGNDITIICNGMMVSRSLCAADILSEEGYEARVLEFHTVKPLDTEAVRKSAEETRAIVTVEEHSIIGGLGGAIAETISAVKPVPLLRVGVADRFAETGPYETILDSYGMAIEDITGACRQAMAKK